MSSLQTTPLQFIGNGWKHFSDEVCNKLTDKVQNFLKTHIGANLFIVTGSAGVGKSSFIKSITGEKVYIGSSLKSGTRTTTLVPAVIGGKRYLFLDMPGFNTVDFSEWDVFYRLMTAMSIVHSYAEFRGVLYVDDIKENRVTPAAHQMLTWLSLFCGQDYMPNVTIVTTRWDGLDQDGIKDKLSRFEKWQEQELFKRFHNNGNGANIYHHGLIKESGQYRTLHIKRDSEKRASLARDEIATLYQNPTNLKLQIYIEIANGAAIDETQAGRWLKYGHMNDSNPAGSPEYDTTPTEPPENASTGENKKSQSQKQDQPTGNGDSSSSPPKADGFWDSWKDLRYEDVKPWINLLITAAREYMRSDRGSSGEYFQDYFEDYESMNPFEDIEPPSSHTFFDDPAPESSSQTSCWPF